MKCQKELHKNIIRAYWMKWYALQDENAPLRINLNGDIRSVTDDYYDMWIRNAISKEDNTFVEVMVIGKIIGRNQLGISDEFISSRIEKMIENGELSVVVPAKKDELSYRRTLKREKNFKSLL